MVAYGGRNFYRYDGNPYYWTKGYPEQGRSTSLHLYVWERTHGPRPEGFQIHHRVRNFATTDVNDLECIPRSEHARLHTLERIADGTLGTFNDAARASAAAWHGSDEGREWHRQHGRDIWDAQVAEAFQCIQCGTEYWVLPMARKRGFCSANCQQTARYRSGVDDEQRPCAACGTPFRVNRYARTRSCSLDCKRALAPHGGVVHNLTVDEHHTYYVGTEAGVVLVHNCDCLQYVALCAQGGYALQINEDLHRRSGINRVSSRAPRVTAWT